MRGLINIEKLYYDVADKWNNFQKYLNYSKILLHTVRLCSDRFWLTLEITCREIHTTYVLQSRRNKQIGTHFSNQNAIRNILAPSWMSHGD